LNWSTCCKAIASQWGVQFKEYGQTFEVNEFTCRVDQVVKQNLQQAIELARVGTQYPAIGETMGKIGESALLLMPMTRIKVSAIRGELDTNPIAQILAIPTFLFRSLQHLFQYLAGLFSDPGPDLQKTISAQVSLL